MYSTGYIAIFLLGLSACAPDDDSSERFERNCTLAGIYHCQGMVRPTPTGPLTYSMTKTAVASSSDGNTIDMDFGTLGSQSYRIRIARDPITNRLTIVAAPGAAGTPYTQMDSPSGAPVAVWPYSSIINNSYDPSTCTLYTRCSFVSATGLRIFEEVLVKQ